MRVAISDEDIEGRTSGWLFTKFILTPKTIELFPTNPVSFTPGFSQVKCAKPRSGKPFKRFPVRVVSATSSLTDPGAFFRFIYYCAHHIAMLVEGIVDDLQGWNCVRAQRERLRME